MAIMQRRMANLRIWLAFAGITGLSSPVCADSPSQGQSYYISATTGDDTASGTSPDKPWRTVDKVSRTRFAPGDRILFRAGDRFVGQLVVQSSGARDRPLRFASYGTGAKPILDGASLPDGGYSAAVLIRNQHHIEISDLEIVNAVDRARQGEPPEWSFGVNVVNEGAGVLDHFSLTNLTIHDVFAVRIAHATEDDFNKVAVSAIRFAATTPSAGGAPSLFRDIVITGNTITRTGRFGVQIGQSPAGRGAKDAQSRDPVTEFNQDIVIKGNRFLDTGGSAVQLSGACNALIEDNDFENTGSSLVPDRMVGRGSGAWVINSRDIVAQHNRSRHVRGYKDSYGMHVDFGNFNVLYQYNYSEDSEGGFVEILGGNRNIIWRYNISVNDGLREKEGNTIWLSLWSPGKTPSRDIYIYNNTIFVRSGLYPDLDFKAADAHLWNNIFAVSREAMIGETLDEQWSGAGLDLAGNLYFGRVNKAFSARDKRPVNGNPRFVLPGATVPQGYRLQAGSPALGQGITVAHPTFPAAGKGVLAGVPAIPKVDFFGTPLPTSGPVDIGAAGAAGQTAAPN